MKAQTAQPTDIDPGYVRRRLKFIPDLTALHARLPERYPHLLASVARGARARYDILFGFPGASLTLKPDFRLYHDGRPLEHADFFDALDREWRACARPVVKSRVTEKEAPPFTGGWFVFLGYELAAQIEPTVPRTHADPAWPVASATRVPAAIIIDRMSEQAFAICETERSDELMPLLEADALADAQTEDARVAVISRIEEEEPRRFLERVDRVQEYINAGDVFQVNLSRLWRASLQAPVNSVQLYRRLCAANPAPFAGLMTLGARHAVISSSPERLVTVRDGAVRTRPIAGTYPRSADPEQDRSLSRDLLRHPKERAEHVMLIDLERNDLGRVCRIGSVRVAEFMALESYPHVHHIVSEVGGELRDGVTPGQVMRAVFPGGTITGCPKVRCMQIIAELEQAPRAAYTGSMGYLNRDGSLDLNILIRTLMRRENEITLRAGAGIVADSVAERELAETRAKAKGMLAALAA